MCIHHLPVFYLIIPDSSPHNMAPVEAQGDTVLDEGMDICDTVL